ncbi:hypothetical protein [Halarchaeum nitratireducens]|uniref:Uncharacterized protein n=1 Tax=Halarchaeum nitratireducens TaxID=489913 RepID=A0A830GGP6_9EURY|nr:hypothetical protein [Halarchaeum nitratireducens]GGN25073.1 hypothetical protein GCM10009021_28690 [Halarchaeum nitratireducens]
MSDTPNIDVHHQAAFSNDGGLEVTESSVETSLEDFGADVDHRDRETRRDQPATSEFGVDDRPEVQDAVDDDEQVALFPETDEDQQTLPGERAATHCLFED